MRIFLVTILLAVPLLAVAQPKAASERDEVYDFKFDKTVAKERAFKEFNVLDFEVGQVLFSSIKGQNCKGKPASYIIVTAARPGSLDRPKFVVFDVSNPKKWSILTDGYGTLLPNLIGQLRSPDFKSSIVCGD